MSLKIIAIGNSFSEDSTRYLHQIAYADRLDIKVACLYRGGCSLEQHYYNMLGDIKDYVFIQNGVSTGLPASIREGLTSDEWDIAVMQQVSNLSFDYATYQPYLNELGKYVRHYSPGAAQVINQTWAYPAGSERLASVGFSDPDDMYAGLTGAYLRAKTDLRAEVLIPCGLAVKTAIAKGYTGMYRDELHMSMGGGRYLLGLVWYGALGFKGNIANNAFDRFDGEVNAGDVSLLKQCAVKALETFLE